MPNMSKMNKPELYKLCKEQQETIKTLKFHNGCLEDDITRLNKELQIKLYNISMLNEKVESLKYCWDGTIHTAREKIKELEEENEILKQNSDADGVPIGF